MLRANPYARYEARHEAMPYQADAVEAVAGLDYAALFHEQGLGKTKMALDLALRWLTTKVIDSVMVVTKKSLVENWTREIKFHTNLQPVVLTQDRQANFYAFNRPGRIYLAHYEVINSEKGRLGLFAKARRIAVILDESQRIKNPDARTSTALHALAPLFAKRVIMTGTPVANRPYDIWSQIFFLDQGQSLGSSYRAFKSEMNISRQLGINVDATDTFEHNLAGVFARINNFTFRETKSTAGIELPGKLVKTTTVDMEPIQAGLYCTYRTELAAEILQGEELTTDDAENVLKRLLRLVQIASNPALVDDSYQSQPGKLSKLDDIISQKTNDDPKTVLWTSFTKNAELLARRYPWLRPACVHGQRPILDRNEDIRRFVDDPDCRVLIATPGAAKEGLTLTVADHAIFLDRTFSLDDYLQAQDRIHRISQTNRCVIENLVANHTIDQWVGELLSAKELAARLTQGDIELDEYREQASYNFNRVLTAILDPEGGDPWDS